MIVIKRDETQEPFNKEKLVSGLIKACKNRPVTREDLELLADDVVESVRAQGSNAVNSADLGKEVLERLRALDEVAYLRFASVYKSFTSVDDFADEVAALMAERAALDPDATQVVEPAEADSP